MDLAFILTIVFLTVFLVLAILLIMALRTPKEQFDPNREALLSQPKQANTHWKDKVARMLVMRPWPYKDLWNPLNRLYWPDEQPDNRAHRRHSRRKSNG
ncbi:MAG: hypothetical protein JOZ18_16225 [Chloroflexi bacterium]|nr:hypothetical protein [Chloroflexota bacterium]